MSPSPLIELEEAVSRAAFTAAPEKAEALYSHVKHIKLNFVYKPHREAGAFEVSASTRSRIVNIHQGALELLWAASFAFPLLFQICQDSQRKGVDRMNALNEAARRIREDSSMAAETYIDADTQGVPGTPPVTATILKKIENCDVFIPDLTFVARTNAGKQVPNPNVMAEFGYALHAKTHAALMPVMNIAFGPPEQLPFDLEHLRHPIQYDVAPTAGDTERRSVRASLSEKLEHRLRLQITATHSSPHRKLEEERMQLVRDSLSKMTKPWQKLLLHELLIRGFMDEPHASGFLMKEGFGHLTGALNALRYHTNLVIVDRAGQFTINPDLHEPLVAVMDEEQA